MQTKRAYVPEEGHYLSDGKRLVLVVGKCREGYEVIDALATVEDEEFTAREVLNSEVAHREWKRVFPREAA